MSDSKKKSEVDPQIWVSLAQIAQASKHNRRTLEWRLSLGLLGSIGAVTYAFFHFKLALPDWGGTAICVVAVIIWACSLLFALPIQFGHAGDFAWYKYYMDCAQNDEGKKPSGKVKLKGSNWAWLAAHCIFLAVALCLAGAALTNLSNKQGGEADVKQRDSARLSDDNPTGSQKS